MCGSFNLSFIFLHSHNTNVLNRMFNLHKQSSSSIKISTIIDYDHVDVSMTPKTFILLINVSLKIKAQNNSLCALSSSFTIKALFKCQIKTFKHVLHAYTCGCWHWDDTVFCLREYWTQFSAMSKQTTIRPYL